VKKLEIKINKKEMKEILVKAGVVNSNFEVVRMWKLSGSSEKIGIELNAKGDRK
jgi:hypothetical protein